MAPTGRVRDEVQKGGEGLGDGDGLKLLRVALVSMECGSQGRSRGLAADATPAELLAGGGRK